MRFFDEEFKAGLYHKAQDSPRQRAHFNLHDSAEDPLQSVAIALLPLTYIPPHQHRLSHQREFFHVVEGVVKLITFSDEGLITQVTLLGVGQPAFAVQLPAGTLHTLLCVSERAFIFEWKQGPYLAESAKWFPPWSLQEGHPDALAYLSWLGQAKLGEGQANFLSGS